MDVEIKHLRHFNEALQRDILDDPLVRWLVEQDDDLLGRVVVYGNNFLEVERQARHNAGAIIWFDVHFGEPAKIGLTWAWNPHAPIDPYYQVPGFWRCWTEIIPTNEYVFTLERCREEFTAYTLQHLSAPK